ncbi:acetyltransferase, variant [Loa loa]|uniref:Acetyltransferase, variant n=1 Tax=Loa loa TaxID=7209 RepID=A0A1I7V945_LOALO|nr:acetyltransferase, variant [Loa loa]EJD73669.1 acetyltransferase, variant [Loa loa]
MHINEHTKIIGQRVILVPYCKCHVAKYHTWMEDEELRRLTASERLSLEEEYEMQARWHEDEDKCTFIVLARDLIDSGADEIAGMVGDVNIFINGSTGELTTMIAESKWRRKGLGEEAVRMMLRASLKQDMGDDGFIIIPQWLHCYNLTFVFVCLLVYHL